MKVENAMKILTEAIQNDEAYCWSWHCNVAMAFRDEGATLEQGNKAASRFMYTCFSVDTSKSPYYNQLMEAQSLFGSKS